RRPDNGGAQGVLYGVNGRDDGNVPQIISCGHESSMVGPAEDGQVSLPATMLDTFRRWCYYPARYFGVCERDIRQLIYTFVAPVSREAPIASNGGSRVGGTSAPVSGGPT